MIGVSAETGREISEGQIHPAISACFLPEERVGLKIQSIPSGEAALRAQKQNAMIFLVFFSPH